MPHADISSPGYSYLNQSHSGESRWWSWGIGLWFTLIAAIIGQSALVGPIPTITETIDPELSAQMATASAALFEDIDMIRFGAFTAVLLLSVILGGIFWIINRATKGTARKIFGWLTGFMVIASVISSAIVLPDMSSPELNAILNKMIGLSAVNYMLLLLTFPVALFGLYLCQKFLHKRTILSLHTAAKSFRWYRLIQAMLITFIVYVCLSVFGHFSGLSRLQFSFDSSRFLQFAIVSLLFIPLQSATEEILVRGYLNQGLSTVLKNKWVAFFITSLLFMALHLANPEATSAASESPFIFVVTMSSYFLFGFFLCLVVDFDGGLESAIGIHAANNLFAAIFVNYEGSALPTPSVFLAKINPVLDLPLGMLGLLIVVYLIYRTRRTLDTDNRHILPVW